MNPLQHALRLMLVTDDALVTAGDIVARCQAAVNGGVTSVQLRLKCASAAQLVTLARELVAALDVPVIVNDRADVALAAGAAGVHLGGDDLSPVLVRRIARPGFVIGASVGSADETERGMAADYWGIGPLRATTTKHDAGTALGMDAAVALCHAARARPAVLIGGVLPGDVAAALRGGFAGVAVVRGILGEGDAARAAQRYREALTDAPS